MVTPHHNEIKKRRGREPAEGGPADILWLSLLFVRVHPDDRVGRAGADGTRHKGNEADKSYKIGQRCCHHVQRKPCEEDDTDNDPDNPVNGPDILFTNVQSYHLE